MFVLFLLISLLFQVLLNVAVTRTQKQLELLWNPLTFLLYIQKAWIQQLHINAMWGLNQNLKTTVLKENLVASYSVYIGREADILGSEYDEEWVCELMQPWSPTLPKHTGKV